MHRSDVFAILAVIVSLISAWITFRATKKTHLISAYDRSTNLFLEIDKALISYPEVRMYFYGGKLSGPDDPNRYRVEQVAELMLDVFEWIWYRQADLGSKDKQGWREYILDMFARGPVLSEYHRNQPKWHPYVEQLLNEGLRGA